MYGAYTKDVQFIILLILWTLISVAILLVINRMELNIFIILFILGLLVLYEFFRPPLSVPHWSNKLIWLVVGGIIIFTLIVAKRVIEVIR